MKRIDLVSNWLSSVSYSHSQSKATEEQYKRVWHKFACFFETTAEEIVADYEAIGYDKFKRKYVQMLRTWISALMKNGLTNTNIKVMVGAVKSFFKYNDLPLGMVPQAMNGVVFHNRDITKDEIVQIMSVSKIREKAFFAVMTQSGLRPHTIAQLRIKNLENLDKVPCKIEIPQEIAKGKYGRYVTFIGLDAIKYLRQYLATRSNLTDESLVFCSHDKPTIIINVKDVSRAFRLSAIKLEESGALKFQVREGKPSELRLYNLRKFFRKYAIQMGFEVVEYMMGHIVKGVDGNYRPQDPEFYRVLYAEKAMPFLRLEEPTPTETTEIMEALRRQHKEEMDAIKIQYEKRLEKIERAFFPKLRVLNDWGAEADRIGEWVREHPEEVKRDQELCDQKLREIDAWKKLMRENPEGVATYLNELDNKMKYIISMLKKNN
ncbi:MAG: site-specific integrase [Candidatus Bathyarchaeota archaeon]|nr:site-specific integrase [Candidatus Bathyarchaeota archaeon]